MGGCAGVAFIGAAIVLQLVGELATETRIGVSAMCFFFALFGAYRMLRTIKAHHIDISGNGQIRLMETVSIAGLPSFPICHDEVLTGMPVTLRPDSTLWPFLLLLNLQAENRSFTVPVLPDSMDRNAFKSLLVACRWIAARPNSREMTDSANFSQ
jgi:hypothetical protein